ncbi:MAG: endolytic transglycosylase MltG, partial [Haloechinothrix sp.]
YRPARRPHLDYFEDMGVHRPRARHYAEPDDYEDGYAEFDSYADDDDESRADPAYLGDGPEKVPPRGRRSKRRRGNRFLGWLAAIGVIVLAAVVAWIGAQKLLGEDYADYPGPGKDDVIVEVTDGDTTSAIASTLAEADVVASREAFLVAGRDNSKVRGIRPGFYKVKTQMSAAGAVSALVGAGARVGELQIRGGSQLDDIMLPNGKRTNGIFTMLSLASCAKLNGESSCVPVERLRKAAAEADLAELGVPEWLAESASKAAPERRLEGLIMPGVYDVKPGSDARVLLRTVVTASATRMEATGLPGGAEATGRTPYEILIIASIIEREAVKTDFERVSRVIYNRLDENMRLEMDSTINYVLDRPEVRTKASDRAKAGEYNTYQNSGLPPTPISSPSPEAIAAAQEPAKGEWLFFVKCEKNGLSCFAETLDEHQQNIRDAQARGAY